MCGIAGIISSKHDDAAANGAAFLRALKHRGPDDEGWLTSSRREVRRGRGRVTGEPGDVLLVQRRLSILDLSEAGWQPMSLPGDRFHITYNGEIYNYVELREELKRLGCVFRSGSDTEVLLHALAVWGRVALPRLVGMFAFAFLDRERRTLLLARDPFGIKPLYTTQSNNGFAFASEIKALLELPGVSTEANPSRLHEYLVAGRTDHGCDTMFAAIQQLPAAHSLEIALDVVAHPAPIPYWRVDLSERLDISYEEATRRVREQFLDNVRLHLRSDVPVGAALSGGIDSSAIVAAMRHVEPKLEIHSFSYIADDAALSEERWVDLVAAQSGAIVHKVHATAEELVDDIDHLVTTQDEPFGSTSIYVQHRVFRLAKEHGIKVMLDGQGADEMLAGYRPYLAGRLASLLRQGKLMQATQFVRRCGRLPGTSRPRLLMQAFGMLAPSKMKAIAKQMLQRDLLPAWLNATWFDTHGVQPFDLAKLGGRDLLKSQLHQTLFATSLPMLLRYEDRNSMAHSIESRVPFLTADLVSLLLRLPEEHLLGPDGTSKRVFRDAMRGIVPDAILDRKDKIGFATPEQRWFATLRPWIDRVLTSDAAHAIPVLNLAAMQQEWRRIASGQAKFDNRVWRWVNLIRWAERFHVKFGNNVARRAA